LPELASQFAAANDTKESVWDYPRPPRAEPVSKRLRVLLGGTVIADTTRGYRVLETSHPPTYYIPPEDIRMDFLLPATRKSFCEWKGSAAYFDIRASGQRVGEAAWCYPNPSAGFEAIKGFVAFYPSRVTCFVDDEQVQPQSGDFYGGWITSNIAGPFKGGPGTWGW